MSLQIRLLLKQSSWLNLHLGHFLTWERPLDALSGIFPRYCLPLTLNWPYPLITGTMQNEWLWIQRPQPVGGDLSVTLGAPGHLSIAESVSCCLHNPFRALLPHQPEGLGGCREVSQWYCLPPGFNQGGGSKGQGIWLLYNMGESLSGQGLYCWGSHQASDCPGLHQAWLALHLVVA